MSTPTSLSDDFTQGNIVAKLIRFMVPILGTLILQAVYGVVDLLAVGQFDTDVGISTVATGSNIINLVTFVITFLTVGITVLVNRYLGEKRVNRVGSAVGGCICFFVVLTAVVMVLLLTNASVFASWPNVPAPTYGITIGYVRICGVEIIFVITCNVINGIFRGLGNSKLPLVLVPIACLVNIVGGLSFVAALHMDVAGAALVTILAQAASAILSPFIIRRQNLPSTVTRQDLHFNGEIPAFLKLGTPLASQESLISISFLILYAIVNGIGLGAPSGYGTARKVTSFTMLISSALMQSMSTFVTRNMGAGKEERARKVMPTGIGLGASVGVIISPTSFFRGGIPASVFTTNEAYIIRAAGYPKGFSFETILTCLIFSCIGYFNGHGMSLPTMVQEITTSFLVRVPFSCLFSLKENASLSDTRLVVPIASLYDILFFIICYVWCVRKKGQSLPIRLYDVPYTVLYVSAGAPFAVHHPLHGHRTWCCTHSGIT